MYKNFVQNFIVRRPNPSPPYHKEVWNEKIYFGKTNKNFKFNKKTY